MGLFSFIGGMIGASKQKKASRNAQAAMLEMLQKAIDQQSGQYEQSRADYAPYREAGTGALGSYQDLLGSNGSDAQTAELSALEQSPMFRSLIRNGEESILQNASATGGIRGGNTQRGLADFNADTFAKTIQQQLAGYGGLINVGQSATSDVAQLGAANAGAISNLLTNQGQTKAGGILTRGGITAGMWNSAGGFADSLASAIAGGMGGGGGISGGASAGLKSLF